MIIQCLIIMNAYMKRLQKLNDCIIVIFNDKVNSETIDFFISEWKDFTDRPERKNSNTTIIEITKKLNEFIK